MKHLIPVHLPFTKPGSCSTFHLEDNLRDNNIYATKKLSGKSFILI